MQKGVFNTHGSTITVSGGSPGGGDFTLQPGLNRLTVEEYRSIRKVPVIERYFASDVGLLRDEKLTDEPEAKPEPAPKADPKPEAKPSK